MANIVKYYYVPGNSHGLSHQDWAHGLAKIGQANGAFNGTESDGAKTWRFVKWDTDVMPYPGEQNYSAIDEAYKKASWAKARAVRNALLAETDYLALSDNTMSAEMTTYRQNLRDLPTTYPNIDDIVWPTKPE